MKPRTIFDKLCDRVSKRLPQLTASQRRWAVAHLFEHTAYYCKGKAWCSDCGHIFESDKCDTLTCPKCGSDLRLPPSRRQKLTTRNYLTILTTCQGLQVQRTFDVERKLRKGFDTEYSFNEVVQLWLNDKGNESIRACNRNFSFYCDIWIYGSMSCKRRDGYMYGNPYFFYGEIYPIERVLPIIKRNGYRHTEGITPHSLMRALLTEPKAETLIKAGQVGLLRFLVNGNLALRKEWHAVKIAIRHKYKITDASMWMDYIGFLRELKRDTHNPTIVCPADLIGAHDKAQKTAERIRERKRIEEQRARIIAQEVEYSKRIAKFAKLLITDGAIIIRPLLSVQEFADEGKAMHHCVFDGAYYDRPGSLIMSARNAEHKRLETIEFSLTNFQVLQSRAVNNGKSAEHEHILNLINKNINKIKRIVNYGETNNYARN